MRVQLLEQRQVVRAEAVGDGGNLGVDSMFFVINDSSLISRSSSANGGNISIFADYFFQSASRILEQEHERARRAIEKLSKVA